MRWIVAIETASPDDRIEEAVQFERMKRLLGRTINAAAIDDDGWSIELTLEAPEPENALAKARSEILTISERIGLAQWPWIAVKVLREEYASAMSAELDHPEDPTMARWTAALQARCATINAGEATLV